MSHFKCCKYSNKKKDGVLKSVDPSGIVKSSFSGFLLLVFSLVRSVPEDLFLSIPVDLHFSIAPRTTLLRVVVPNSSFLVAD